MGVAATTVAAGESRTKAAAAPRAPRANHISDEPGPLAELQGEERREWVRESVARLPETLRQTLILAYHQGLNYREIAEILKIPVGTVKSRLHAALAKLQQMAKVAPRDGSG